MSCFIVAHESIEALVGHLNRHGDRYEHCFQKWHTSLNLSDSDHLTLLARSLHRLNCDAYDACYPGEASEPVPDEECPAFRPMPAIDTVAAYKLTLCLAYQCAEGDCPERPLFRALHNLERALAFDLIEPTPDYRSLPWR